MARSPSERLEPTRPPARPRRRKDSKEPRRTSPFLRSLNGLLTFILLLMLGVGAAAYVFDSQIDAPGPLDRAKTVVIPKGEGTHEIALRLEREGIITDRRLFIAGLPLEQARGRGRGRQGGAAQAGDYAVKQNASVRQVIDLLSEGKTLSYRVTVPEGLTSHQIVERLRADANLAGEIEGVPPEGSLLPETLRHRARHAPTGDRRPHAGGGPQGHREGLAAAQEGPAAEVSGGGSRAGLDRGEGDGAQRRT